MSKNTRTARGSPVTKIGRFERVGVPREERPSAAALDCRRRVDHHVAAPGLGR